VSWDDDDYYDVSFGINKSRRYHAKLRDFYQGAYNWTVGTNAVAGSAAFVAVLGSQSIVAGILSGIFAVASVLEAIFRYEGKARHHQELCRRFTMLAAEMERLPETPENLAKMRAARLKTEAEETSVKRCVELMASNEEARSRGVPESKLYNLSVWQCNLGYLWTMGLPRLAREKAEREAREEAERLAKEKSEGQPASPAVAG
jgi:hypothetical protein